MLLVKSKQDLRGAGSGRSLVFLTRGQMCAWLGTMCSCWELSSLLCRNKCSEPLRLLSLWGYSGVANRIAAHSRILNCLRGFHAFLSFNLK